MVSALLIGMLGFLKICYGRILNNYKELLSNCLLILRRPLCPIMYLVRWLYLVYCDWESWCLGQQKKQPMWGK